MFFAIAKEKPWSKIDDLIIDLALMRLFTSDKSADKILKIIELHL